jgi:aspartate/methionine/tyrosine aminotransferase
MAAGMNFSKRTSWNLAENELTTQARLRRATGQELLDLTISNPTECGFRYETAALLAPLADPAALRYTPEPFGMASAREAVALYYRDHGATIEPSDICLATSTSEAYSYLFRLLCDPGDEVLAARPSYPLFDFIAQLDDVVLREYPLHYDPNADREHGWSINLPALESAITPRTRAILVVHPNNPTGNFISAPERAALQTLCAERGLALIVDEVFLDYVICAAPPCSFAAGESPCLTFVLSGLSKVCALPQMKASWIAAAGPVPLRRTALSRLEVIADTFLSMNAPIQTALPQWLAQRSSIQRQIHERVTANLTMLDARLHCSSAQRLAMQGGWTAVLRVSRVGDFALDALERGVLVQPGELYGLPAGRAVLSLLTPPNVWARGLALLPID